MWDVVKSKKTTSINPRTSVNTTHNKESKRKTIVVWRAISLFLLVVSILCFCYFFFVNDDETLVDTLQAFQVYVKERYEIGSMWGVLLLGASVGSYFGFGEVEYKEDNVLDRVVKVIGIIDFIVFIVFGLSFVGLLFVGIGFMVAKPMFVAIFEIGCFIYNNHLLCQIVAVSLCSGFVSFLLLQILMRFTNYYRHIAIYRIVVLVSFFVLLSTLLVGFGIGLFKVFTLESEDLFMGVFWLVILVVIVLVVLEGRPMFKDFHFLFYDRSRYLLYLRSFSFDDKEDVIAKYLDQLDLPVMKIGNPKTFFPKGIGETYYLPSVNWKEQLDYYISRAQCVFVAVDNTEGVLWEMFEHLEYLNKFIYYVEDRCKLEEMLKTNTNHKIQSSILMECFKKTLEKTENKSFCFRIIENKCFCSDAKNIPALINNIEQNGMVPLFLVDFSQLIVNTENNKERKYRKRDWSRLRSRSVKKGLKMGYKATKNVFLSIITIVVFLAILFFGVGFVALGIDLIFDESILGSNRNDRWVIMVLSFIIGVRCLRKFIIEVSELIKDKRNIRRNPRESNEQEGLGKNRAET